MPCYVFTAIKGYDVLLPTGIDVPNQPVGSAPPRDAWLIVGDWSCQFPNAVATELFTASGAQIYRVAWSDFANATEERPGITIPALDIVPQALTPGA